MTLLVENKTENKPKKNNNKFAGSPLKQLATS